MTTTVDIVRRKARDLVKFEDVPVGKVAIHNQSKNAYLRTDTGGLSLNNFTHFYSSAFSHTEKNFIITESCNITVKE